MALVKWKNRNAFEPWNNLRQLQDEINDLFDFDRTPATTGLFDRNAAPAVDVAESEEEFTVTCELPGMEQDDIDVSITSNALTIKGERKKDEEEKDEKHFRRESWSGSFQRTLPMPATIDPDKAHANLKDGMLKINLPKKEDAKPKQINVNIS